MKLALLEAKNKTISATSLVVPNTPNAVFLFRSSIVDVLNREFISV